MSTVLKEFTQTNHYCASTINVFFTSKVFSESGIQVEKSSKTTDTTNGTILIDTTNQNSAFICTLEKQYVTVPTAGLAVITKESQEVPYVGLQRNRYTNTPHCPAGLGCTNSTGKYSITGLSFCYSLNRPMVQWIRWN